MSGDLLLDTNIVIALFARDPGVQQRLEGAHSTYISCVTFGELLYGAWKSERIEENLNRARVFALEAAIVGCDEQTAEWYGRVKNQARLKGALLPHNDLWIAATALQHDMTLVTRDAHFASIEGLNLQAW